MELVQAPITPKDQAIGEHIAEHVLDGATIQLGIGSIPYAVVQALKYKKNLGIHSEMSTEGMVDLIKCGAVTNAKKNRSEQIHRMFCHWQPAHV